MNGFIIFFIFVFVIVPVFKNIMGAKPASKTNKKTTQTVSDQATQNWAEVQKLVQQRKNGGTANPVFGQRDKTRDEHGHSAARKNSHQRLHSQDSNKQVFTESHQARVKKRDQRDRSERNRIEAMIHSKTNRSIVRAGNNSIDEWGVRGDRGGGNGFLFLILFGLIALLVLSNFAPDIWADLLETLNIT